MTDEQIRDAVAETREDAMRMSNDPSHSPPIVALAKMVAILAVLVGELALTRRKIPPF